MIALGFISAVLGLVLVLLVIRKQTPSKFHASTKQATAPPSPKSDPATGCLTPVEQAVLFTQNGVIYGRSSDIGENKSVRTFMGLPRRAASTTAPWLAFSHTPHCVRPEHSPADCLSLNVWAPPACNPAEDIKNKTVIVALTENWFSTALLPLSLSWAEMAASEAVVVFVPNYRRGIMGFLNTGNQGVPGNAGLFDLITALRWIKRNAPDFGGEPDSMVALGQGSGAAMLSLALGGLGQGFFKRDIFLDMSPFWLIPRNDRHVGESIALRLCRLMGCHEQTGVNASLYLQRSYTDETLLAYAEAMDELWFVPSFDQEPLTFPPEKLVGNLEGLGLLCGVDSRAGKLLFHRYLLPRLQRAGGHAKEDETRFLANLLTFFLKETAKEFEDTLPRLVSEIKTHYGSAIMDKPYDALEKFFTDLVFRCPMMALADAAAWTGENRSVFHFVGTTNDTQGFVLTASQIADFAKSE
ncbi:cholinesterase 1-like [Dermacentor variabilis]|uniref:cholinesterase 1-like n=1 Tax=Dermacentor variabilis TaxID=34621 RepID=UPI003F5C9C57